MDDLSDTKKEASDIHDNQGRKTLRTVYNWLTHFMTQDFAMKCSWKTCDRWTQSHLVRTMQQPGWLSIIAKPIHYLDSSTKRICLIPQTIHDDHNPTKVFQIDNRHTRDRVVPSQTHFLHFWPAEVGAKMKTCMQKKHECVCSLINTGNALVNWQS